MRKKFFYFVLVPLIAVCLLLYFFLDTWVEAGLELAGGSVVGAKVEIDNLHLTLSPLGMEFSRLQAANPRDTWKNTLETGRVKFALDVGQLLRSKFIIETMEVNELILGTKRTTDGALSQEKKPEPASEPVAAPEDASLSEQGENLIAKKKKAAPVFDLERLRKQLNIDSLLNVQNLLSVQHIDSLKVQITEASQQWQAAVKDLETIRKRAADVESSIKAININELKTIQSVTAALKNVNDARAGIKKINDTFSGRRVALTSEVNKLSSSIGLIDDLARRDFQNTLALARLPDVSMKGLAELLLSRDILATANEYLSWVDFARLHVKNSSATPENTNPPRMRGQTIPFPSERAYPKFWIKKIVVSGGTDRDQDPNYFYAKGEVTNISSNHRETGFPIVVDLSATQGRGTKATVNATLDRTHDEPLDTYEATLTNVPVGALSLGRSDFLPSTISNAVSSFSIAAKVPAHQFDANARITMSNVKVSFERPPRNTVERLVREVLEAVSSFNVMLRLWKEQHGSLDVAFETNLDNLLAERTRKVIGDEVTRLRNELRQKVERKISEKRGEVERLFNQKKGELAGQLKTYEGEVNEKVAVVEAKKKDLEDKIQSEKKKQEDALKKKAQDALKGILKKKN